jgi:uncharacterized RDD family membrane protein YckC
MEHEQPQPHVEEVQVISEEMHAEGAVHEMVPARFLSRFGALFIDGLILKAGLFVVIFAAALASGGQQDLDTFSRVLGVVADVCYMTFFVAMMGGFTPGKKVVGVRIVDMDGNPIGIGKAALRAVAMYASFLTLGIGFLMALFTQDKRALHDYIAGTRVVQA